MMVNAGLAAARCVVEKVPSAPEWVSVSDRLPKSRVRVLVAYNDLRGIVASSKPETVCGHFESQGNYWVIDNVTYAVEPDKVTHWQPLPAPPFD